MVTGSNPVAAASWSRRPVRAAAWSKILTTWVPRLPANCRFPPRALPRNSAVSRRHSGMGALVTPPMLTEEDNSVKIESMLVERNSSLARRAAVHAALADPARLAITDTPLAGDASPSEPAGMPARPSNLLAHHLRVLEQAGVIARRRAEGDR